MKLLKQSTSVVIKLGPFLDSTDGVTAETALTLSQSDIIIFKNYGAGAQKNDATSATHDTAGWYGVPLNTTDTATLGPLQIHVNESGALPVFDQYMVVTAQIYNSLVAGTDLVQVDVQELGGSVSALGRHRQAALGVGLGTSTNAGFTATTSIMDSDITEATADHYVGRSIVFVSGALDRQATLITDYALVSGRGRFTFSTLTEAVPDATDFVIV